MLVQCGKLGRQGIGPLGDRAGAQAHHDVAGLRHAAHQRCELLRLVDGVNRAVAAGLEAFGECRREHRVVERDRFVQALVRLTLRHRRTFAGETQVAEISDAGAIFGEMAALLGGAHTATVRATGPVKAYRIDDAKAFMRSGNEIVYHVATILARRLQDATTYLADFKRQFAGRNP